MRRKEHHLLRLHIKQNFMHRKNLALAFDIRDGITEAAELRRLIRSRGRWWVLLPFFGTCLIAIPIFYMPVYSGSWFMLWIVAVIVYLDSTWFVQGYKGLKRWPNLPSGLLIAALSLTARYMPFDEFRIVLAEDPLVFAAMVLPISGWVFAVQRKEYFRRWYFRVARIYFRSYYSHEFEPWRNIKGDSAP